MLKVNFLISTRSFLKDRFNVLISVIGLSMGLCAVFYILAYIMYDLSYDKFYTNANRIYRVKLNNSSWLTPGPLASVMRYEIPEVESSARISSMGQQVKVSIPNNNKDYTFDGVFSADSTILDVFDISLMSGDASLALKAPNSAVITKSTARILFPEQSNIIGREIRFDDNIYVIQGLMDDPPSNTHWPYNIIVSYPKVRWITKGSWTGNNFCTYVKLKTRTNKDLVDEKLVEIVKKYVGPEITEYYGKSLDEHLSSTGNTHIFTLVRLTDIWLKEPYLSLSNKHGSLENLRLFSIIAFLILLIAIINLVNLNTYRASLRSSSIIVNKILGASNRGISGQFIVESLLITIISALGAFIFVLIFRNYLNSVANRDIDWIHFLSIESLLLMFIVSILCGISAGFYSFTLAGSNNLSTMLKSTNNSSIKHMIFRKILVTSQYTISFGLICITILIYLQYNYIVSKDLGFDAKKNLVIRNLDVLGDKKDLFYQRITNIPGIATLGFANRYPALGFPTFEYSVNTAGEDLTFTPRNLYANAEWINSLELEFVAGRNFRTGKNQDINSVIVNESFISRMPSSDFEKIKLSRGQETSFEIIGVIKDFNFSSLYNEIDPLVIRNDPKNEYAFFGVILLDERVVNKIGESGILSQISNYWNDIVPDQNIDIIFLDQIFREAHMQEVGFQKVFFTFSFIAILITALGVLSLASLIVQSGAGNWAIKKVLGASGFSLIKTTLYQFLVLILVGSCIAIPISYWFISTWLDGFAYRISIGVMPFIISFLLLVILTIITMTNQLIKVVNINPIVTLRNN